MRISCWVSLLHIVVSTLPIILYWRFIYYPLASSP
jgi:hypothetical protein